jgi:hypothetical protein
MSQAEPGTNGDRRVAPRLPLGIVVGSLVIALASMTFLILLLYEETRGPGEILRQFARRVDRADCPGSYELLHDGVRAGISEDEWCAQILPIVDEQLDASFTLEQAVLEGDLARLEISGVEATEWELTRFGDRSWRVVGPPDGLPPTTEG